MIADAGNCPKFTVAIRNGDGKLADLELLKAFTRNLLYWTNAMPGRFLHFSLQTVYYRGLLCAGGIAHPLGFRPSAVLRLPRFLLRLDFEFGSGHGWQTNAHELAPPA